MQLQYWHGAVVQPLLATQLLWINLIIPPPAT